MHIIMENASYLKNYKVYKYKTSAYIITLNYKTFEEKK